MREPLKDSRGRVIYCMHPGCGRRATKIVGCADEGNTLGQTHDCCSTHCYGEPTEADWLEGNDPRTERERMEAATCRDCALVGYHCGACGCCNEAQRSCGCDCHHNPTRGCWCECRADFSRAAAHLEAGVRAHADRDGLTGVRRAVFIDRGCHAAGEACPSAEPSPPDPHEYWCAAPVPGQPDDSEPCTCGATND